MIITLPWPDAVLFPNAAMRDGAKFARREAARLYRNTALFTTGMERGGASGIEVGAVTSIGIDFFPPNNRRDLDGMLSAIKPAIDGIFDEICQNDRQVSEIMLVRHPADKLNPRVVISLIEKE